MNNPLQRHSLQGSCITRQVRACMRHTPVLCVELDCYWHAAPSHAQRDVRIILWIKDDDLHAFLLIDCVPTALAFVIFAGLSGAQLDLQISWDKAECLSTTDLISLVQNAHECAGQSLCGSHSDQRLALPVNLNTGLGC